MQKVMIILTLALIVLGLHCYTLHKRVAYYENECDREYARGMCNTVVAFQTGLLKVFTNKVQSVNEKGDK